MNKTQEDPKKKGLRGKSWKNEGRKKRGERGGEREQRIVTRSPEGTNESIAKQWFLSGHVMTKKVTCVRGEKKQTKLAVRVKEREGKTNKCEILGRKRGESQGKKIGQGRCRWVGGRCYRANIRKGGGRHEDPGERSVE